MKIYAVAGKCFQSSVEIIPHLFGFFWNLHFFNKIKCDQPWQFTHFTGTVAGVTVLEETYGEYKYMNHISELTVHKLNRHRCELGSSR